ncbi:MAG: caspase family protein, partial [Bacteroidota bacterium]
IQFDTSEFLEIFSPSLRKYTKKFTVRAANKTRHIRIPHRQEKRLALVIANEDYSNIPKLDGPINETKQLVEVLKTLDFEVLDYYNVDQQDLFKVINFFQEEIADHNVIFFYFSGHAIQLGDENFILPVNVSPFVDKTETIALQEISANMNEANKHTNIIVLDACRSIPQEINSRKSVFSNQLLIDPVVDVPSGSFFAFATSSGEEAVGGIYTPALTEKLKEPMLDIENVFKQVRFEVKRKTNGLQIPEEKSSLIGKFIFNKGEN